MINIIGFNFVWFGLVFWGNTFIPFALLILFLHLACISKIKNEGVIIISITLIGVFTDLMLAYVGVFIFEESNQIPLWLIVLWSCFAATICHGLSFLKESKLYQALAGGFIAPLSYLAGYHLQVVDFSYSLIATYVTLSIIWAGLFILFFYFSAYFIKIGDSND
ncbi:DUF2878 domain-containing protein [Thalassotalea piscium]|uniref:ABC-type iron transport system FetAB permease component n=1 Tax=Thalassotalea piscium TaxID=1230533 RepID=A0A7X0NGZ6_9GAMM|nr:DUF2878 domain-containing protein [Thalassotalea piscium]MBB6543262.1 ABC-type iron transport system FetAB permease component [Thalassotalea piscium]